MVAGRGDALGREGRESSADIVLLLLVTRIKGKEPQLPMSNETPSWWQQQQQPGFTYV